MLERIIPSMPGSNQFVKQSKHIAPERSEGVAVGLNLLVSAQHLTHVAKCLSAFRTDLEHRICALPTAHFADRTQLGFPLS
jgi:hypothetical protein